MTILGIPYMNDKYSVTMDLWPLEAKEFNRIYQFYDNLRVGRFTTTKCKKCSHTSYPPRVICPECYSEELEYVDLTKQGKVIVLTEQVRGVPLPFDAPLIHAWIDLGKDSPVKRILSRIINCPAGRLKEGDMVQLAIFNVPSHPIELRKETKTAQRVFFAFEPVLK